MTATLTTTRDWAKLAFESHDAFIDATAQAEDETGQNSTASELTWQQVFDDEYAIPRR